MNTTRVKKTNTLVPTSLLEANLLLGSLGNVQNQINEIEKELQQAIEKLKAEALRKLEPLEMRRNNQVNALFAFANPRKDKLTDETRSVALSLGTFGWRLTTPRVDLGRSDEEMINFLKRRGYFEFVRVKEEIDRQKLLAEKPRISGITYVQKDEFFVVPKQIGKKPKTITKAIDR